MKYDVFVSYSRRDSEIVRPVVEKLKAEGFRCWMDVSGIESGDAFKQVIVNAIRESNIVLFFSSIAANESGYTIKEINVAVELGKAVIPIKIDGTPYADSIMLDLSALDYISDINGTGFAKLLKTLSLKLTRTSEVEEGQSVKPKSSFAKKTPHIRTERWKAISLKFAGRMAVALGVAAIVALCYRAFYKFEAKSKAEGMLSAWKWSADLKRVERCSDESDPDDEEYIVSLLKSLNFDCDAEFQWGYCESRNLNIKGYESSLVIDNVYISGERCAILDFSPKNENFAANWISRINDELNASLNVNSCLKVFFAELGGGVYCKCEIPIEALRRLPSPEVQRKVLEQMLTLPASQVKANKPIFDVLAEDNSQNATE